MIAGIAQDMLAPGRGDAVDIQVGFGQRLQALAAELGQACVDTAGDAAEIGITGIAQAEHGELQLGQLRCATALQEFHQADRIVRRIAFALGADDEVEQTLAGQFAGWVGVRALQAHAQAGGLGVAGQALGGAAGVARLAAVEHGQALFLGALGMGAARHQGQRGRRRMPLRQTGGVAGQPPQRRRIQALDHPRQQYPALFRQGAGGQHGAGGGHSRSRVSGGSPMLGNGRRL